MQSPQSPVKITREDLLTGAVRGRLDFREDHPPLLSDAQIDASLHETLAGRTDPDGDVWLFGYGSLIWNPAFQYVETRIARVQGWHRRFGLWTKMYRGSHERPGLVLGLDAGGSCRGVVFRIPAAEVTTELGIVWRREMLTGAYAPRWVDAHCPGEGQVRAVTFVINSRHPLYAGHLGEENVARVVATAAGCFGPCAEYFFSTLHALKELGIEDARLNALRDRVLVLKHAEARVAEYAGSGV